MVQLRQVMGDAWSLMSPRVLTSPMTEQGTGLPSRRTRSNVFPQVVPRDSAQHDETYLIKSKSEWEYADIRAAAAEEIRAVLAAHAAVLHETSGMFELLPEIAREAGFRLPVVSDDAFFKMAYRAGAEAAAGRPFTVDTLCAYMMAHFGTTNVSEKLYQRVLDEVVASSTRADLEEDLDAAWSAREHWTLDSAEVDRVWDVVARELSEALARGDADFPADPPDMETGLDAGRVVEMSAQRWGLCDTATVERPDFGTVLTLPLDLPLERTIVVRVLSVLGRGVAQRELTDAGVSARELLDEAVVRSALTLGLTHDASRRTVVLSALAADLLQVEEPKDVAAGYGPGAQAFGRQVSRSFSKAVGQWRRYAGLAAPKAEDGPEKDPVDHGAASERIVTDRALADAMQAELEEAHHLLVRAVWTNQHSEEVRRRDAPDLRAARSVVTKRGAHVASEMCNRVKGRRSDAMVHERLAIWIQKVCLRLEREDAVRIVGHRVGPLPPDLREAMRRANDAVSREEGAQVRITAAQLARYRRMGRDRSE